MRSINNSWNATMNNSKQLLRIAEVSHCTTLGKSTINLWVAQGKFPRPIMLSPTIRVWKGQQINDWIDSFTPESEQATEESLLTPL
jgi:prophage regulatory protein